MATHPCPSCGANSVPADYCDSCGTAFARMAAPSATASFQVAAVESRPNLSPVSTCLACGSVRTPDDLFCEACGLDFTRPAPALPKPPPPPPTQAGGWIAALDADRSLFDANQAECPQPFDFPEGPVLRKVPLRGEKLFIGRRHEVEGFFPDIDLAAPVHDPGVSRRHAVLLRREGGSWALVDNGSTNGTWLNHDPAPLEPGVPTDLHDGDRIRLGLFTVITVRRNDKEHS